MKRLACALALSVGVLVPSFALALPVSNTGGARCQCTCKSGSQLKDLDWLKSKTCVSSDNKNCRFWANGRWNYGKLESCWECRAGAGSTTEWICKRSWAASVPGGSIQPAAPAQQPQPAQPAQPAQPQPPGLQ